MKKFKKLIPALCMLLISAVLMGTSTYAWFSMNTTVTANGMEVKAKSESEFLQIINEDGTFSDTDAQATATAKTTTNKIKPITAVKEIAENKKSVTQLDNTVLASNIKWAEAFSADPTKSEKATDYKEIQSTALNDYVLLNTFKVRMNPKTGVQESAGKLKVSDITVSSTNTTTANDALKAAVSVLFVCGDNFVLYKNGKYITKAENYVLVDKVTTIATEIKVYIFFDGEDDVTTTNNGTLLGEDGYKVEFSLSI